MAGGIRILLAVILGTGLMLVIGIFANPKQFYHSYLFGYVLALDISLGALFWVLIHHVSDAGWSVAVERQIFRKFSNQERVSHARSDRS